MYAVIATGGKQFKVAEGQQLKIEKLPLDVGADVEFPVLMVVKDEKIQVGAPYLTSKVKAVVVGHGRGEKVKIVKFRRRKHHRKQMGHRQDYTEVKISTIQG